MTSSSTPTSTHKSNTGVEFWADTPNYRLYHLSVEVNSFEHDLARSLFGERTLNLKGEAVREHLRRVGGLYLISSHAGWHGKRQLCYLITHEGLRSYHRARRAAMGWPFRLANCIDSSLIV